MDDLRRAAKGSSWSVREGLDGTSPLPRYRLGGVPEGLAPADPTRRINWTEVFAVPPKNPYLLNRVVELGLLSKEHLRLLPTAPKDRARGRGLQKAKGALPAGKRRKGEGA